MQSTNSNKRMNVDKRIFLMLKMGVIILFSAFNLMSLKAQANVCELDGVGYSSLSDALNMVYIGQNMLGSMARPAEIKLLQDINDKEGLGFTKMDVVFNLNGHNLTTPGIGLERNSHVDYKGAGTFKVIAISNDVNDPDTKGVVVSGNYDNESSLRVTSVEIINEYCVAIDCAFAKLNFTGDLIGSGDGDEVFHTGHDFIVVREGTVTVNGNITENGNMASNGILAWEGSIVTVNGNINVKAEAVRADGEGIKITVNGNTSNIGLHEYSFCLVALRGAEITVTGSVAAASNIAQADTYGKITIKGKVTTEGIHMTEILESCNHSVIVFDAGIPSGYWGGIDGANNVRLDVSLADPDDCYTQGDYLIFGHETSEVWVRIKNFSGIDIPETSPLKVRIQNGTLYASGLTVGEKWTVYDITGKMLHQSVAAREVETWHASLPARNVYIVQSGNRAVRVFAN